MNIVWEYREKRESDFFSPRISNAQRLANGITLICEGDFGRLFEVTASGKLVWEYVNPYFGGPASAQNNRVFRAYRYSAEEIARARVTGERSLNKSCSKGKKRGISREGNRTAGHLPTSEFRQCTPDADLRYPSFIESTRMAT